MANKETRISKSNTFEEFRKKSNDISLHLGDNEQLNARITDKTFNFDNVSAGEILFSGQDDNSKTERFEIKLEESLDNTGGYIILKGSPSITGFNAGSTITQSGGYNATIVSVSTNKILVKNSTGVFNPAEDLTVGSDSIDNANVDRIVIEAYPVGLVRVYVNNTEIFQNLEANGFHVPNYGGFISLLNTPTVTDFTEGSIVYQGTNLANATFSGTVLNASSTQLKLKNYTGDFYDGTQIKLDGSSSTIVGANHGVLTNIDNSIGNAIELNTPTSTNDDIKIYAPSIVDAVNELQNDIGNTAELDTESKELVEAINEIEAIFDASEKEISAGTNAFNVTSGEFTIDSSQDIILDADDSAVILKDNGTQYGVLTNTSSNLLIKSGSDNMLTGSGADATFARDVSVTRDLDVTRNLVVDSNTTIDGTLNIGDLSASFENRNDVKAALNEVHTKLDEKVDLTSATEQSIVSELSISGDITFVDGGTNADTVTFNTGTTLDLSDASLVLPGATSDVNTFGTAFLEVDGDEQIQGFSVDRAHVSTITNKSDVKIQWNENHADGTGGDAKPARAWQLVGLNDSNTSHTSDIVTFYNAKDLISNNAESGINVTWDSTNENFDFDVNDPILTFTGDVTGSGTLTNLGNLDIALTLANDSVDLTTHTTGDYVSTLDGTEYQISISGAGTEGREATVSLPNDFRMPGSAKVLGDAESSSSTTGALTVAGGVGIADDLYVGGDLYVEGDTVELNTETLTVEDTLILAGNDLSTEPSTGGFGLEVGPITSPSGVAGGVTGAHSIVYNYANDRWEADGSLILSEATVDSPDLEVDDVSVGTLSGAKTLDLIGGTGIGLSSNVDGDTFEITINNTLDGYNHWKLKTGGTHQADITDADNVDFRGGADIDISYYNDGGTDRVTINHSDVGTAGTYGQSGTEDGTYIKSLTVSNKGHVTAVTSDDFDNRYDNYNSWDLYADDTLIKTIESGDRMGINGSDSISVAEDTTDGDVKITHGDTSTVEANFAENNSGNTFIQDLSLTFDDFGHVIAISADTSTVGIGDGTLTVATNGNGISVPAAGSEFTANQNTNKTITISSNATSDPTANTIAYRTSDGNIKANAFKSEITEMNTSIGTIMTQVTTGTGSADSYIRPAEPTTVKNAMGLGTTNTPQFNGLSVEGTNSSQIKFHNTNNGTANKDHYAIRQLNGYLSISSYDDNWENLHHHIVSYREGAVNLRHNNDTKLTTYDSGVDITGNLRTTGNMYIRNTGPKIYLRDTNHRSSILHQNSNLFYVLRTSGNDSVTGEALDGHWPLYISMESNNAVFGGSISARGNITAYSSDERLKENIVPIPNALEKVSQLKGCTFDWKDKVDEVGFTPTHRKNDVGLIAQDVEKVLPQLVTLAPFDHYTPDPNSKEDESHLIGTSRSGEDYKTVQYDRVVSLLVEAVKELKAEVDELKGGK